MKGHRLKLKCISLSRRLFCTCNKLAKKVVETGHRCRNLFITIAVCDQVVLLMVLLSHKWLFFYVVWRFNLLCYFWEGSSKMSFWGLKIEAIFKG